MDNEEAACIERAVKGDPSAREVRMAIMAYCGEARSLDEIEAYVGTLPQARCCLQDAFLSVDTLVRAGALCALHDENPEADAEVGEDAVVALEGNACDSAGYTPFEDDEQAASEGARDGQDEGEHGEAVLAERKAQPSAYLTTDVGMDFLRAHSPERRFARLLEAKPARRALFRDVMGFCQSPRTYGDISRFVKGRRELRTVQNGETVTMQPSVIVDELERAGAIVWDSAWELTEEGESMLAELRA